MGKYSWVQKKKEEKKAPTETSVVNEMQIYSIWSNLILVQGMDTGGTQDVNNMKLWNSMIQMELVVWKY